MLDRCVFAVTGINLETSRELTSYFTAYTEAEARLKYMEANHHKYVVIEVKMLSST